MSIHGLPHCWSCGKDITPENHCKVAGCEVCFRCWNKVPHAERIKIAISVLDRAPGGVFSELVRALERVEQSDEIA